MGRKPTQPCGTHAAYVRHLYHGEKPCNDCQRAHRIYELERLQAKKQEPRPEPLEAVTDAEAVERVPVVDADEGSKDWELRKARHVVELIEKSMEQALPRELATLSRSYFEAIDRVRQLAGEGKQEGASLIDELAKRRAERLANS